MSKLPLVSVVKKILLLSVFTFKINSNMQHMRNYGKTKVINWKLKTSVIYNKIEMCSIQLTISTDYYNWL